MVGVHPWKREESAHAIKCTITCDTAMYVPHVAISSGGEQVPLFLSRYSGVLRVGEELGARQAGWAEFLFQISVVREGSWLIFYLEEKI